MSISATSTASISQLKTGTYGAYLASPINGDASGGLITLTPYFPLDNILEKDRFLWIYQWRFYSTVTATYWEIRHQVGYYARNPGLGQAACLANGVMTTQTIYLGNSNYFTDLNLPIRWGGNGIPIGQVTQQDPIIVNLSPNTDTKAYVVEIWSLIFTKMEDFIKARYGV